MSKFENFEVNGGNNQFGDNNTQNNITNNTTNNHNNSGNKDDSSGTFIGALAGIAGLVWFFFNHIDQIYHYLNLLIISSFIPSISAFIILLLTAHVSNVDIIRVISSSLLAVSLYGLALIARSHAPDIIINLAHQAPSFIDFWKRLSDIDQKIAVTNFISVIVIGIAAFLALLGSLRQFAYSLAKSNRTGWWYNIYRSMSPFNMRLTVAVVTALSGFVWALLSGKIPFPPTT